MSHSFKSLFTLEFGLLIFGLAAAHAEPASGDSVQAAPESTSFATAAPQQGSSIADDDEYGLYRHIVKNPPKEVWISVHNEVAEAPPQSIVNYGMIIQPVAACENPYGSGWGYSNSGERFNHHSNFEARNDREVRQDPDDARPPSNSGSGTVTVATGPTLFNPPSERPSRERGVQR